MGELAGQAQLRGRPRPQNHAWIAACCLRHQMPLVTLNTADFEDFAEHHGLVLLGDRTSDQATGPPRRREARNAAAIRPNAIVASADTSRVPQAPRAAAAQQLLSPLQQHSSTLEPQSGP
ncbi:MAG: hypothetical protein ACRDOH_34780 [Streptosporangiaceae bacterium]